MPLFIFINNINANNSNQAVKELDMCETNNKEFKNAIKYTTATLAELSDSVPKE